MNDKAFFTKRLLQWNTHNNKRWMPWKGEKDPYKIWISEIILQQTRVIQGLEYYNRFILKFPNVHSLAKAKENDVFKVWEGLGYYSRCKNIITSSKFIANELQGNFPDKYEDLLQLRGVGVYTASAIASFAYNLPHAVVDGNVFRVLSRYFGNKIPVDSKEGKVIYNQLAGELLDTSNPALYNQAIMDFGAEVCKPAVPLCTICPLKTKCIAWLNDLQDVLPVKEKRIKKTHRYFYYLQIKYKNKVYVRKRIAKDIWQNLFEFFLIETSRQLSVSALLKTGALKKILPANFQIEKTSPYCKQQLTHQTITGQVITVSIKDKLVIPGYHIISEREMAGLAFPQFITACLKD
ncbi:MAG: A/G-specific adenine glycosylase [Chitinophagaceae bacterium]|nr:A/G-specific adenine glycosylase [Chitinophagaceae bacterium]